EVVDALGPPAEDATGLARGAAKQGRLGEFSVEIGDACQRLGYHDLAILDGRHRAARIESEILGRLVLAFGEFEQPRSIFDLLGLERQQDAPRIRTSTSPVHFKRHGYSSLSANRM